MAGPSNIIAGGKVRSLHNQIACAAQGAGTLALPVNTLPKGACVLALLVSCSGTPTAATLAIGITGTTGKYRAAAVTPAVGVVEWAGVAANLGTPLTAAETLIGTIAGGALPATGNLNIDVLYVDNS